MMNLVELEISKTQAIKIYLPCQKEDVVHLILYQ